MLWYGNLSSQALSKSLWVWGSGRRRRSHPHNWILNAPVFAVRLIDLRAGMHWPNRCAPDCMVYMWNQKGTIATTRPEPMLKPTVFIDWLGGVCRPVV